MLLALLSLLTRLITKKYYLPLALPGPRYRSHIAALVKLVISAFLWL